MDHPFLAFTRCRPEVLQSLADRAVSATWSRRDDVDLPHDPGEAIDVLRLERWLDNCITDVHAPLRPKSMMHTAYYFVRPLMPVRVRKHLQLLALRGWDRISFPAWPVDTTVEQIVEAVWASLLEAHGVYELPFVWFWPDKHRACAIMTHDVETRAGRDFCTRLLRLEKEAAVVSSFEIIPEIRYEVPEDFLQGIRDAGCEICVHGFNHDGHLFDSRREFRRRAPKIRDHAARWGAVGFRSPVMYRNLELLQELEFAYDMSVPNVGHLDPQHGGCCTVMPYFIGRMLELPLTTIQDYSLYNILSRWDIGLWREQMGLVLDRHGLLTFLVHPDYTLDPRAETLYRTLLQDLVRLRQEEDVWLALPREVDAWSRQRQCMQVVETGNGWRVAGPGSNRACVAFAFLEAGRVRYRIAA